MDAGIVLAKPFFKALSRGAYIVSAVGTAQYVEVRPGTHAVASSFEIESSPHVEKRRVALQHPRDHRSAEPYLVAILRDGRCAASSG
jgi:hypothetical protein